MERWLKFCSDVDYLSLIYFKPNNALSKQLRLLKKIKIRTYWIYQDFLFILNIKTKSHIQNSTTSDYAIGITTFLDRYNLFFKDLINKIVYLFPDKEIIVAVNGHIKTTEQTKYLEQISEFTRKFKNVFLIKYNEPQGLSRLWNEILNKSASKKVLMLNDDLKIAPSFRSDFENANVIQERIAVINNTWGHFFISKEIIEEVGWFDENLLEIGGEDDDYCARLAMENIPIKHFNIKSITNFSKPLKANSYGKDMTGEHRYSAYNTDYLLNKKWLVANEPFEGSVYVADRAIKYWKLRS